MTRAAAMMVGCVMACTAAVGAANAADVKQVATVKAGCTVSVVDVSQSGNVMLVGCDPRSARVVDVASSRELRAISSDVPMTDASVSHDGRWVAIGLSDGTVEIASASGAGEPKRWKASDHSIHIVQFLGDGDSILVAGLAEPGKIWDVSGTPKVRAAFAPTLAGMTASAVSPDGKTIATADGDTPIRVYDAATGKKRFEFTDLKLETFSLAFTLDGKWLLAGGADELVTVIDVATGKQTATVGGKDGVVMGIAPTGDGNRVAVRYMDADSQKVHWAIWNLDTKQAAPFDAGVEVSSSTVVHGKLWLTSSQNETVKIWEVE